MAPGPFQIIIIVLVILLLFGAGKLPRIMEDMAKGINSFKKGLKDEDNADAPSITDQKNKDDDVIDAQAETVSEATEEKAKK